MKYTLLNQSVFVIYTITCMSGITFEFHGYVSDGKDCTKLVTLGIFRRKQFDSFANVSSTIEQNLMRESLRGRQVFIWTHLL